MLEFELACRSRSGSVPFRSQEPDSDETSSSKSGRMPISHALNENFATDELMEELRDRSSFGKRGEFILVAQLVCIALVIFPPMQLQGLVYLAGAVTSAACLACTSGRLARSRCSLLVVRRSSSETHQQQWHHFGHSIWPCFRCLHRTFAMFAADTLSMSHRLFALCHL